MFGDAAFCTAAFAASADTTYSTLWVLVITTQMPNWTLVPTL
jgi:hypothetical protein